MSFDVDVVGRRGETRIAARFASDALLTVLLGPSGVGKTSVLHMIAGLVRPERGHVRVGGMTLFDRGVNAPPERRRAGYVFQEPRLFPHLNVRANLLYGAPAPVRPEPVQGGAAVPGGGGSATGAGPRGDVTRVATMLGIADLLGRWPRTLSGGEARRVAIGRALLRDPAFLLLDEPLSSLDPARKEEAMRLLERVRDGAGVPILLVTHDVREAERLGGAVVEMRGDGREPAGASHVGDDTCF